jgi:hypothetical protein
MVESSMNVTEPVGVLLPSRAVVTLALKTTTSPGRAWFSEQPTVVLVRLVPTVTTRTGERLAIWSVSPL